MTTESRRFKLNYPEDDVYKAIGRLCVMDITQRGMNPDKKRLAEYCRKVAKWLTNDKYKPCVILAGNVGTGKTTIVRAVNRLFSSLEIFSRCFIPATALAENFMLYPEDAESHFCRGNGCTWLLLDDLGEEQTDIKEYGNIRSPFIKVVAGRYDRQLPLLATTNLRKEDIVNKYGERTLDRLNEMAEWIPFSGISFRK